MIKFLNAFLFIFASCIFVSNNVRADFSSRHSLMPAKVDEVESSPSDVVTVNSIEKEEVAISDNNINYDEPVVVDSEGIMVDDGNESFFLKRPKSNVGSSNQNFNDDFSASGPKLDKPEGYDELMQMVREQGGVMKPSSYTDDGKGNLILRNKNEGASKPVVSNVIDERKEDVIVKPLFADKKEEAKAKAKVEKLRRPVPIAKPTVKKNADKTLSKPAVKPVRRRSSDVNEIEIYSSDNDVDSGYEDKAVVHVASYNTKETADRGFDAIVKKYPQAYDLEPFIRYEVVEGKGYYWRLYLLGDEKKVESLCRKIKSDGDWCNILK